MGERAGSGETSLGDLCVRLLVWMGSAIGGEWFWSCTCRPVPPARHRGHASGKVSPMEQFLLGADQLRGRGGGKWTKYPADVIPAFVADMDFKVAPAVQTAITQFTDTQDYGYGTMTDAIPLFDAFAAWMARRHRWQPDPTLTHANTDVIQGLVAMLVAFTAIAAAHNLMIVSDEIHADLVYPGATHIPMETIEAAVERTVTLTSATKGFNIAGLRTSIAHFGSAGLKEKFDKAVPERLLGGPSRVGVAATIAAWCDAEDWLDTVMVYLDRNRRRVAEWAAQANLAHYMPEATYLAWMNCRHIDVKEGLTPQQHMLENAKVALSDGTEFGEPGHGHVRLNFATSEEILEEILGRLGGL